MTASGHTEKTFLTSRGSYQGDKQAGSGKDRKRKFVKCFAHRGFP